MMKKSTNLGILHAFYAQLPTKNLPCSPSSFDKPIQRIRDVSAVCGRWPYLEIRQQKEEEEDAESEATWGLLPHKAPTGTSVSDSDGDFIISRCEGPSLWVIRVHSYENNKAEEGVDGCLRQYLVSEAAALI
jgi:hypothetical protein